MPCCATVKMKPAYAGNAMLGTKFPLSTIDSNSVSLPSATISQIQPPRFLKRGLKSGCQTKTGTSAATVSPVTPAMPNFYCENPADRIDFVVIQRYKADLPRVVELADTLDLGSCAGNGVGVQVPPLGLYRCPVSCCRTPGILCLWSTRESIQQCFEASRTTSRFFGSFDNALKQPEPSLPAAGFSQNR